MKINAFPVLSENPLIRYFNFIALYIAQGIPEGMLFYGIPAWMAMNGNTPGEIGGFAIACGLPWSFKFIVAPLMDRYTYLPMGRKRLWVIIGQMGLIGACINMAFVPDPLHNLSAFYIAGFIVSFFGAFQDVATDGMAVDVIPADQQARANGFMWGSKIIGTSASLALGSWLVNAYSFTIAFLALAMMIGLIMLVPILLRERPGEKTLPWTKGQASPINKKLQLTNWKEIFISLSKVFTLRNSLIIASIGFIIGGSENYMNILLPLFTVKELGWTDLAYSQIYAAATLFGGIGGMLIGGILIDKFGKKRMLNIYFITSALLTLLLVLLKSYWNNPYIINSYMFVYALLMVFCNIGIFAICMQCCWKKVSASQFTLYMTLANLGRVVFAALIGPITSYFNWGISLLFFAGFICLAWLLLQFFNIDKQVESVQKLETIDLELKSANLTTS